MKKLARKPAPKGVGGEGGETMRQFTIQSGSRVVVVTVQSSSVSARLYVDGGEVATLETWKGKTEAGARKWAARKLA